MSLMHGEARQMRNDNSRVGALVGLQNLKGNGSIERWSQRKTSKTLRMGTTWYLTRKSFQWNVMTDMHRKVEIEGEVAAHLIATHIGAQRRQEKNGEDEAEAEAGNNGAITRAVGGEIGAGTIRKVGRIPANVTMIEG